MHKFFPWRTSTHAQVVKRRGESMAAAAKQGKPHGMLSIIGLSDAVLEDVCAKARAKTGGDTVCRIANYLFPTGRVASGHKDALAEVPAVIPLLCNAYACMQVLVKVIL